MHRGCLVGLCTVDELRRVVALPVRLRFVVAPCNTGRLLERIGPWVEVAERGERLLAVTCRPETKAQLLRSLDALCQAVDEVALEPPGLPDAALDLLPRAEAQAERPRGD